MQRLRMAATLCGALAVLAVTAPAAGAVGGPVILGGDDLTDHGGQSGEPPVPEDGWIYIEAAIANLKPQVGRPNDGSIAALGSYEPEEGETSGAGAAIKLLAARNGMPVRYFGGPADIQQAFVEIAAGAYRPAILWISGSETFQNDLTDHRDGEEFHEGEECTDDDPEHLTEGEALALNAAAINAFVNEGGGLMSHGTCYDWLFTLIPGLSTENVDGSIGELDPILTADGQAAFPSVTNEMISGQWHNHFVGDLGGLKVLAAASGFPDANGTAQQAPPTYNVIIGGGQVSLTEKPADLAIAKVDSADPATARRNLTYTLTVTNNGPNPATGVTATDTLPAGLSARSSSASQGSCSGTTTVTCSLGNLASGASATVSIVVRPAAAGTLTNTASVTGNQPDPNSANNSASQTTTVVAAAPAQVDRRRPVVSVGGVRASGCLRSAFTARISVRDASQLRRVVVSVDGRTVRRTSSKRFTVRVPAQRMRSGRHTLRVLAVDARGNRRVVSRAFRRCAPPVIAPVFTG